MRNDPASPTGARECVPIPRVAVPPRVKISRFPCSRIIHMNKTHRKQSISWFANLITFVLISVLAIATVATPAWAVSYNNRAIYDEDFSHRDLREDSFDHATLRDSDFSYSNLQGVRFFSANLSGVNFEGADLRNADLESTRLTRANLNNAVLEGAFMTNSLLQGATITGADFTNVLLSPTTEKMLCKIASGTNPTTGRDTKDTLFCP